MIDATRWCQPLGKCLAACQDVLWSKVSGFFCGSLKIDRAHQALWDDVIIRKFELGFFESSTDGSSSIAIDVKATFACFGTAEKSNRRISPHNFCPFHFPRGVSIGCFIECLHTLGQENTLSISAQFLPDLSDRGQNVHVDFREKLCAFIATFLLWRNLFFDVLHCDHRCTHRLDYHRLPVVRNRFLMWRYQVRLCFTVNGYS